MTIEAFVVQYLSERLDAPVSGDIPGNRPARFVTVEQTGSRFSNYVTTATVAVQSWAESRAEAMALNERVKAAMAEAVSMAEISRCVLETDYNFPDLTSKTARYQAVFEIVHFF